MPRVKQPICVAVMTMVLMVVWVGCGCEERTPINPVPPPATATAPAEKPLPKIDATSIPLQEPTPAFPGFAAGRIFRTDGKLIDDPSLRVEVLQTGLLDDSVNTKVSQPIDARPDGVYVGRLQPGTYQQPSARIEFSYNKNQYRLPLTPRPPEAKRQDASEGVSQDFVWKLDGQRPGDRGDKLRPETWIGGSIYPEYRSFRPDLKRVVQAPPPGTKVIFTLIPKTPLPDGTQAKTRTAIRNYNATNTSLNDGIIVDLPLAFWEVRGEEVFPDGSRSPLLFLLTEGAWADSVTGTFQADLARSALKPVTVTFTRRE
ncbi:hypothetical protein [Humisphaera borealis]|uniref:Uncharacterized protein n=1 Tax=Humisphaera borealis TaxID=2807512 RepID=A0A7M2WSK3_9BACT|nr:hypothetical protein [Humisphaera borealis]QOV87570.1 hypothetical protein IPV69_14870 [Humisphaera borealis]